MRTLGLYYHFDNHYDNSHFENTPRQRGIYILLII